MHTAPSTCRAFLKGFAALSLLALTSAARAQTLYSESGIALDNNNQGIFVAIDQGYQNTGSASYSKSFTGLDHGGNTQTMTITGQASNTASYGQLHGSGSLSITNPYYNASNPVFWDGSQTHSNGSPDTVFVPAWGNFHDIMHYGGSLQTGDVVRYLFHMNGVITGTGSGATLAAYIDNNPAEYFSNSNPGVVSADWATKDYAINAATPQDAVFAFYPSVNIPLQYLQQGQNVAGSFDLSCTLTGIEVRDAKGNLASGVTLNSASGKRYNLIEAAVPEPGSVALFLSIGMTGAGLLARRRARVRRSA